MDPNLAERYRSTAGADAYRRKYDSRWTRRLSNWRELSLVANALRRLDPPRRLLDCPCGAGRLISELAPTGAEIIQADFSAPMLRHAADVAGTRSCRVLASAVALPFASDSFDVSVCHRLIHHLPAVERTRVFSELSRVTRDAVILSFSDAATFKGRRMKRRGRASSALFLEADELAAEAAAHHLRLDPPVLRLFGWTSVLAVAVLRKERGRNAPE